MIQLPVMAALKHRPPINLLSKWIHTNPANDHNSKKASERYRNLSRHDREILLKAMAERDGQGAGDSIGNENVVSLTSANDMEEYKNRSKSHTPEMDRISKRIRKEIQRSTPSYMRRYPLASEITRPGDFSEFSAEVTAKEFSPESQTVSLIEDVFKANIYESMHEKALEQWPRKNILSDSLKDNITSAIREHIINFNRPVLTNLLADYSNPYMMKRQIYESFLHAKCLRNTNDEKVVKWLLNESTNLQKLTHKAAAPPEVVEPLFAFNGVTKYSFDDKISSRMKITNILDVLKKCSVGDKSELEEIIKSLPETITSDQYHPNHPFRNHFGFETCVPYGTCGGITMGRPMSDINKELRQIRYPTLQRVAHSLPKDGKYRSAVKHAINTLEISKDWSFEDKLKAINTMKEVFDNLACSRRYSKSMKRVLTTIRARHAIRFAKPKSPSTSISQWLCSVTTERPHWMRSKTK